MRSWLERFWFLRGVAGAIALAQLVPEFMDLSRYEFLRAAQAVIIAWDSVASRMGQLIGTLPFLPQLTAFHVNAAIFTAAFGVPAAYVVLRRGASDAPRRPRRSIRSLAAAAILFASVMAYAFVGSVHVRMRIVDLMIDGSQREANLAGLIFLLVVAAMFVVALLVALVSLKGYARGLVLILSFILTLQVLYYLDAPYLADWIDGWADRQLPGQDS